MITKFRTQGLFGDIGKLQSLLNVAKKDVVIDDGFDVLGFLPQAKALTGGHITFHTLPILKYSMINGQSVNEIDPVAVKQYVQDLFYPKPKPSASPSPSSTGTTKGKTKIKKTIPLINQANGKPVDGSAIPCVN